MVISYLASQGINQHLRNSTTYMLHESEPLSNRYNAIFNDNIDLGSLHREHVHNFLLRRLDRVDAWLQRRLIQLQTMWETQRALTPNIPAIELLLEAMESSLRDTIPILVFPPSNLIYHVLPTNIANADGSRAKVSMRFNDRDTSFDTYIQSADNPRPRKVPRTEEEFDQAFPYHIPTPQEPEPLSQETLDLYRKAIDATGSLTDEEILSIQDWVSDAVVDERCRTACGINWHELVTRAVEKPQDLTSDEVLFIQTGRYTTYKDSTADLKRVFGKIWQPEHIKNLWMDAQKATTDPRYAIAKSNVKREGRRIRRERREALTHLSNDDTANIKQSTHIPWIAQLTASSRPHWGLVCFRTAYNDNEAWELYKEHILRCSRTGLWAYPGTDSAGKKWKIDFIEDDPERLNGASLEDLRVYFNTPPSASSIASSICSGLPSDAFLFADARTISSLNDPACDPSLIGLIPAPGAPPFSTEHLIAGYVNAVDASYDPSKTYAHDFKGSLKVHPAHVATTFYHRLISPGQEQKQGSEQWWKYKQDWETMFMRANGNNGRDGGVYPPMWSYNR